MLTRTSLCLFAFAACGGDTKSGPDASTVPAMITVSGITQDIGIGGRTPLAGVTVAIFGKETDTAPRVMAVSDAAGAFSLSVPTMGQAVDGYLLATISGHLESYLYPPAPLIVDTANLPILVLTQSTFDTASTLGNGGQTAGHGFVAMEAVDASQMPIGGVTFTTTPAGTIRYNMNSLPNKNPTMADVDGIGYAFQLAPGTVTVNAAKSGLTFRSHAVNARADKVTLTLIQTM